MNNLLKLFIGICTIHLGLELISSEWTLLSKPLLMPTLGLYLLSENSWSSKYIKSLLLALFFSTTGDGLLMFTEHDQLYFIAGLASFLVAHLFYIYFFVKNTIQKKLNPKRILALGLYMFLFIYLLQHGLTGILLYAVPIYACILAWMAYTAIILSYILAQYLLISGANLSIQGFPSKKN